MSEELGDGVGVREEGECRIERQRMKQRRLDRGVVRSGWWMERARGTTQMS